MIIKWFRLLRFLCRITALEYNLENALYKCRVIFEDTTDEILKEEMDYMASKIENAMLRTRSVRRRGINLVPIKGNID